jgi:uncharacterized alkaline shock family protein YloU
MRDDHGLELSQDVLFGIAQLSLEGISGVRTIAPPTRVGEFLTGRRAKGIQIERHDEGIDIAITVAMTYGERIPEVAKAVQRSVREAVGSMTGLKVRTVDVHVEAIDVPPPPPTKAPKASRSRARTKRKGAEAEPPPAGATVGDEGGGERG